MRKIKLLYLIDTLEVGGAEKSLLEMLKRAVRVDPLVCSIYAGETLAPAFHENGIRVVSLGLTGKYEYRTALKKVLTLIRHEKPDLIHTSLTRSHFVGRTAGKMAKIPVISGFVNDSYSIHRYARLTRRLQLKLKATQLLDRITARWAFHFIANSNIVKGSICRSLGIPEDKVSVIYRGRHPSDFVSDDGDLISNLRHSLSLTANTPMILNVGRLTLQKAQRDLIHALPLVHKQFPVCLFIAGEGPCRSDLTGLIQQMKLTESVTLLGNRSDVPRLLLSADLFVFPSYYEGHPGSLVEAMFAGCPIVASDIPVHRETIIHKETGFLVPVGNPEAIADAILWILQNPESAQCMGKRAQDLAMSRFHIDRIVNLHEELCTQVLDRWRKRIV